MFTVCQICGEKFEDVTAEGERMGRLQCQCGAKDTYQKLPLFILTGASGVGKSTVGRYLQKHYTRVVTIGSDVLWNEYYNQPKTNYREYRETWLKLCKNIAQNGKPVLLAGCAVPEQFEICKQRKYFATIHYIALVTSNAEIEKRLMARPGWRKSGDLENIRTHQQFNVWLKEHADRTEPRMMVVDSEKLNVEETGEEVARILEGYLSDLKWMKGRL